MRRPIAVLVVSLLVSVSWLGLSDRAMTQEPAAEPELSATGVVTSHGYPVKARVEVRREGNAGFGMPDRARPERPHSALDRAWRGCGQPLLVLETGADGRFSIRRLEPGIYSVTAVAGDRKGITGLEVHTPLSFEALRIEVKGRGPTIEGRAVWSDGRPFRGVVSEGPADEQGRFRVVSGRLFVVWQEGRFRRRFRAPKGATDWQITVDEGLRPLEGRVLAADDGKPIVGARILAGGYENERGSVETATVTDAEGNFRVAGLPESRILASAEGRISANVAGDAGPVEIRLARTPVVTGRVLSLEDGRPVPGVPVYLLQVLHDAIETGRFMSPAGAECVSDAKGGFTMTSPVAGDVMVFAFGRGWITPGLEDATSGGYNPAALTLVPGERRELDVSAVRSPSIAGRLTEPGGKGVAGVLVTAGSGAEGRASVQWRMGWFDELAQAVTGPDGSYRIPTVVPGLPWSLDVWIGDRPGTEAGPVTPVGSKAIRMDLPLPTPRPDRFVEVRVVSSADGKPVVGAKVRIATKPAEEQDESFIPVVDDEILDGITGADGKVRIGPFTDRPLVARARHGDHAPVDDVPVPEPTLEIRLAAGHVIAGRAIYPDGAPAAGASFSVARPGAFSRVIRYRTDDEGRFRIRGLPDGEFEVEVPGVLRDEVSYRGSVVVEAGKEDAILRLEENRSTGYVPGPTRRPPAKEGGPGIDIRIRDDRGNPVPSGTLLLTALKDFGRSGERVGVPDYERFEIGEARFTFGKYEKAVWIDARPDPSLKPALGPALAGPFKAEDSPVTIVLGPAGAIAGKVSAPEGASVRGVRVYAVPMNAELLDRGEAPDSHGAAWADAEGRFEIAGLGSGSYLLTVSTPPPLRGTDPVRARVGGESPVLRLAAAVRPTITVLDGAGEPLPGVEVHAHHPDAEGYREPWTAVSSGKTDENGRVRLSRLDPEEVYLLILTPSWEREDDLEEKEVEDWEPVDSTISLGGIRALTGVVLDREGFPIRHARIWYRVEEEWEEAWGHKDGTFEIGDLTSMPATLLVGTSEADERDDPGVTEVEIDPDETEVELRIDGRPLLAVRVEGWPQDVKATAHASYKSPDGIYSPGKYEMRSDGRFRRHAVPKNSTCAFWVALPDGRMAYAGDLEPDAPERTLTLRPGKTVKGRVVIPDGARKVTLSLWHRTFNMKVPLAPDGSFEVVGLPDGKYSLFPGATVGETKLKGSARVNAGDPAVEITMKPK